MYDRSRRADQNLVILTASPLDTSSALVKMPARPANRPTTAHAQKRLTPEQMAALLEPSAATKAGFRKQVQAALDRELTGALDPETVHIQPHEEVFERQNSRGYFENITMWTAVDGFGRTSQWSQRIVGPRSFFPRPLHSKKRALSEDADAVADEAAEDEDDINIKVEVEIEVANEAEEQQHTPPRRKAAAAQVPRSPRKTRRRAAAAAPYDEDNLDFDDASTEASHLARTRSAAAPAASMLGEAQPGPAPVDGEGEGRGKRRCSARMRARVGTAEFEGVRGGLEGLRVYGTAEPDVDRN